MKQRYNELKRRESGIFRKQLSRLKPMLDYIRSKGYRFHHPNVKYVATEGPIIGVNKEKNLLYIYSLEANWVKEINLFNTKDEKNIPLDIFIERNDFEFAILGLLTLENFTTEAIKEYNDIIKKSEELISKYDIE